MTAQATMEQPRVSPTQGPGVATHWGWLLFLGLGMTALGVIGIGAPIWATWVTIQSLAVLLWVAGVVELMHALASFRLGGFVDRLVMGVLYLAGGAFVYANPVRAAITLTFVMAIFFVIDGLLKIVHSVQAQGATRAWLLFGGIASLAIGFLIRARSPAWGLVILGLFVGIVLLQTGITNIMLALGARRMAA